MPIWASSILKFILDWALKKIWPIIVNFLKGLKIEKEVSKEQKELDSKDDIIEKWVKENPGKPLPPEFEQHLRDSAGKRARGL